MNEDIEKEEISEHPRHPRRRRERLLRSKRIGKSMKLHGRKILRPSNSMIYIFLYIYIYILSNGSAEGGKETGEGGSTR